MVSADTVRRFILEAHTKEEGKRTRSSVEHIYGFLVYEGQIEDKSLPVRPGLEHQGLSAMLREFFSASPEDIRNCKDNIMGTYRFFAVSEDRRSAGRPYVVRGAIRFYHDEVNDALVVEERQEGWPVKEDHPADEKRLVEVFRGYFLAKGERVIAILTRDQNPMPKFYILDASSFAEDAHYATSMYGTMLKPGRDGVFFSSIIHMTRDQNAFEGCDIVPAEEIRDRGILDILRIKL